MHMESVGKVLCQNVVLTWGVRLSAAYLGCEAQKRASEILRYKTTHNLTYAQAAKQVDGRGKWTLINHILDGIMEGDLIATSALSVQIHS